MQEKKTRRPEDYPCGVPIEEWGKDHWSTFAYIETRIVDYGGQPDREHMRNDPDIHPGYTNSANHLPFSKKYPTRLRGGIELEDHDDWSCLDDAEKNGLLVVGGTGLFPVYVLTEYGKLVAAKLRHHKAHGGNFGDFTAWLTVKRPEHNGPSQKQVQAAIVKNLLGGAA